MLSNSSPLLEKILISSTLVSPILVRSLDPVTNRDFVFLVFNLNRSFVDQFSSSRMLSQSFEHIPEVFVYGEDKLIVESCAKMSTAVGCDTPLRRSFVNTRKSNGESADPCGTPCVRVWDENCTLSRMIRDTPNVDEECSLLWSFCLLGWPPYVSHQPLQLGK